MLILRKILLVILLMVSAISSGQEFPQFSQHVHLQGIINPAYNGSREAYSALLVSRTFWGGAISSHGFNAHATLPVKGLGAGVVVLQDNAGLFNNLQAAGALSYSIHLNDETKLALGLQGGIVREQVKNVSSAVGGGDNTINNNFGIATNRLSTGWGLYLHSKRYFAGLSMPEVMPDGLSSASSSFYESVPLLIYGGTLFNINEDIKIKPTTFVKMNLSLPLLIEVGASAYYKDFVSVGLATRAYPFSSLVFSFDLQVIEDLFVTYSYDLALEQTKGIKKGAHEISLRFDMPSKRLFIKPSGSMRYF